MDVPQRDALERNAIEKYHLPLGVVESTILVLDAEPALQRAEQKLNKSEGKMGWLEVLLLLRIVK